MKYILLIILLSGCASKPYISIDAGYILNQRSDWNFTDDRKGASNPCDASARVEIGLEKRLTPYSVGSVKWAHNSNLDCGYPFDDYKEYFKNSIELGVKLGGL